MSLFCLRTLEVKAVNKHLCSTWGNYHVKTFDGRLFQLPRTSTYNFASKCVGYMDFTVKLQWKEVDGTPTLKEVTLVLNGVLLRLANSSVIVQSQSWVSLIHWSTGWSDSWLFNLTYWDFLLFLSLLLSSVTLPYSKDGILVERIASYVKVEAKLGFIFTWNEKDSLRVREFNASSYLRPQRHHVR